MQDQQPEAHSSIAGTKPLMVMSTPGVYSAPRVALLTPRGKRNPHRAFNPGDYWWVKPTRVAVSVAMALGTRSPQVLVRQKGVI